MIKTMVCCLSAGVALTAQAPSPEQQKYLADVFARYDRSGDGRMARAEFPGSDAQWKDIDADGDGQVGREEFYASPTAKRLIAAYDAAKKEPRGRTGYGALAAARLRTVVRFDKNRDGAVTRGEWPGNDIAFGTLDLDGNGVLDARDKRLADTEDRGAADPLRAFTRPLPGKDAVFAKFDRNEDGTLTATELAGTDLAAAFAYGDANGDQRLDATEVQRLIDAVAYVVARRNAGTRADVPRMPDVPFATWDKDKDGRLANAEFEIRDLFSSIDTDRDGYVTKEEIARYRRSLEAEGFIARFDLNDDGRVTLAEFAGAVEVFRRADRNGDGVVSKQDS